MGELIMPVLAWRNDADGYAFSNSWTFDAAERAALTALAQPLIPAVLGTIAAVLPLPDPILWTAITTAVTAAAQFPAVGPLPEYGLCGGMAYTALDHWNARVPIPRGAHGGDWPQRTAAVPTAIRNTLWQRLLDSLGPGGVLQKTLEWSLLLNQVPKEFSGGGEGLKNRTRQEWDRIRAHIDAGRPWPIGLVCTTRNVWDQHQVLVYGYENTGPEQGNLLVYENNKPSQFGEAGHFRVALDFRGSTLAGDPPSGEGKLAGFFCSNYFPGVPVGMSRNYGEFLGWTNDARTWMVTDGVRMPIASAAELSALGGTAADVRSTTKTLAPTTVRPRDGALFRERSASAIFLYAGGSPFLIPDANWLGRFGGPGRVRVVPDNTIAAFAGPPDEGTLLREWSDQGIWLITGGVRRRLRTPDEVGQRGGAASVRVVPDGALAGITEGLPLPEGPVLRWSWLDMGKPQNANIRGMMGAVSVKDTPTAPERPHVFMEGNDYNLWCRYSTGASWAWTGMSKPPAANIIGFAGVVSVMDTPTSPQRAHLFVLGNDGNLWCRWSSGAAWSWDNLGKPQSAHIRAPLGAAAVMDTPTSGQRPHVFVEGNDYNVWCLYFTGAAWAWTNMGKPATANIIGAVGAVSVMDTPTSPQRPHLFAVGNDGNLWCRWSNGASWSWDNLGKPQGANIHTPLGAVAVRDTPASSQRPHVFVLGNDYNLWCLYFTGAAWAWTNMGKPATANIVGSVGAVSVMDTPTSPQRPHLFVAGNDGNLWCRWSNGASWKWDNMGNPQSAHIRTLLGSVTVMDTPTSLQRPHVFVEGSDGHLWCHWLGVY